MNIKKIVIDGDKMDEVKDMSVKDFLEQSFTGNEEETKEVDDELVDLLFDAIMRTEDKDICTILEIKFHGADEGIRIDVGGSKIAGKAFCNLGDGFEKLYEDVKEKFREVAAWINDRMNELGVESQHIEPSEDE
jgi:hypothetical protein